MTQPRRDRWLVSPTTLFHLDAQLLREWLRRYSGWCRSSGLDLDDPRSFGYKRFATALQDSAVEPPGQLVLEASMLTDLSSSDVEHEVLETVRSLGMPVSDDKPIEDIVLRLIMQDSSVAYKLHLRTAPTRFLAMDRILPTQDLDATGVQLTDQHESALQTALNDHFATLLRGRTAEVVVSQDERYLRFLISRGDTTKRHRIITKMGREMRLLRPEVFDMTCIDRRTGELLTHCSSKRDRKLYCRNIGKVVFSDPQLYDSVSSARRFDFAPLYKHRDRIFESVHVPGLEWVKLHYAEWRRMDHGGGLSTHSGEDIWDVLNELPTFSHESTPVRRIAITAKMKGIQKVRTAKFAPPFTASYGTDAQGIAIEEVVRQSKILMSTKESRDEYERERMVSCRALPSARDDTTPLESAAG